jgi:hypothetical protein
VGLSMDARKQTRGAFIGVEIQHQRNALSFHFPYISLLPSFPLCAWPLTSARTHVLVCVRERVLQLIQIRHVVVVLVDAARRGEHGLGRAERTANLRWARP